jgi:hypothetical protein
MATALVVCFVALRALAVEGMWVPLNIHKNIQDMQQMGLRLTASELYNELDPSLKDGIVRFGRGCTGSFISADGLVLTNHHCGYGQIQAHSSVGNDYLTHGFWAPDREGELPNEGLTVSILVRMEDVTERVLGTLQSGMTEADRATAVREASSAIVDEAREGGRYEAQVSPFFYGDEYFLFVYEVFRDVRLVGAPPSSIGKFGGDVDNWMWPRHSGDFALFRVYAGPDNGPADFHEDNIPYRPAHYFPLSNRTPEVHDFTMVYGFPGRTSRYLTSGAVALVTGRENPMGIGLRTRILELYEQGMSESDKVRIQYAAKHARISNAWKRWMGENRGLERLDAIGVKRRQEAAFERWTREDPGAGGYAGLMDAFSEVYQDYGPLRYASRLYAESIRNIELVRFASGFETLVRLSRAEDPDPDRISREVARLRSAAGAFFRDYNQAIDQRVAGAMIDACLELSEPGFVPPPLQSVGSHAQAFVDRLFSRSILATEKTTMDLLAAYRSGDVRRLERDPAFAFASAMEAYHNEQIRPGERALESRLDSLYRLYTAGLRQMNPETNFFPDANGTLRISYGRVEGSYPRDAVAYLPYATAGGILEKAAQAEQISDYRIPERLERLIREQDFVPYNHGEKLVTNFIASNHTTGGNSGSPVLGASGELIGLNFDRSWESTMSDILFDPEQCRNISVNSQYILWVIGTYAGQGWLIEELHITP